MSEAWRDRVRAEPGISYLADGDDANVGFAVRSIRLFGGASIELQPTGVTVIVGANNAGKSTILRETFDMLSTQPGQAFAERLAVEGVEVEKAGSPADIIAWVAGVAPYVSTGSYSAFSLPMAGTTHASNLAQGWAMQDARLGPLAGVLAFYGNAQGRFGVGASAEMRDSIADPAVSPLHHLQDSLALLEQLRGVAKRVFNEDLTLDTLGRTLRIRVGKVGVPAPPVDAISMEYLDAMTSLRALDDQGDGMRSVMGQLLPLVTASHKLILLDEPEAFLHPPQSHALGEELGSLAVSSASQIVIATHDRSLLTGLLASGADITVVRVTRDGGVSSAHQLNAERLRSLWQDPVLRYTNLLDGLFHRLVVVAEAEPDCAYLAAALDVDGREDEIPRSEVLFVPTGGKAGMAKACSALRALDVRVVAAPDLDIVNDVGALKLLVESLGGVWSGEDRTLWDQATESFRRPREQASIGQILAAVTALLHGREDQPYTDVVRDEIRAATRAGESPWADVKRFGIDAFRGQAYAKAVNLLESLAIRGVVPVREGELERLAPEVVARKGPGWLPEALERGSQGNRQSQEHLDRIMQAGASGRAAAR